MRRAGNRASGGQHASFAQVLVPCKGGQAVPSGPALYIAHGCKFAEGRKMWNDSALTTQQIHAVHIGWLG